jgi:uncharacterized YigZ family protein
MSADTYYTITNASEGLFKNKGSKFLAFAYPADDENVVKEHIQNLKKKYHDARHHCYAYRIGTDEPFRYRMNDDGEPSGTAGKPIYGQILSKEVTNILIAVVRYFGGTLLGTSGLIQAYKAAAEDALDNARIEQKVISEKLRLHFSYDTMNAVMRIIKDESIEVKHQDFQEECRMEVLVRRNMKDIILKRFSLIENLKIIII